MKMTHQGEKNRFVLTADDGGEVGVIEYKKGTRGRLFATHTLVHPAYEGKGYAGQLLDALVDFAKAEGFTIVPSCPYVAKMFERHPEKYAGVIGGAAGQ